MQEKADSSAIIKIVLLSLVLTGLSLWINGDKGLDLYDEGFLWYGAIHTALGKVPLRDFQSYEPFRYYWAAAWFKVFGSGIHALRISAYIFLAICLPFGLLAARRALSSFLALCLAGLLIVVWVLPAFKVFDIAISLVAIFFAVRLIERPAYIRHFAAGIFVGFSAFIGRNHGIYGFLAFFMLIMLLWFKAERLNLVKKLFAWAAGILAGFSPMLFMMLLIPGFFHSFLDSVLFFINHGATNLPLPVPWPWSVSYSGLDVTMKLLFFSLGSLFLIMPVFYSIAFIAVILTPRESLPRRSLFIASTLVGIFYMHYAFSRAHIGHLSHAMPSLTLALASVPAGFDLKNKKAVFVCITGLISVLTFFTAAISSPYAVMARGQYVPYYVFEDRLWIPETQANYLSSIKSFVSEMVRPEEGMFIAPFYPGLYCILKKESPLWEIYFLFPKSVEKQRKMVQELMDKNIRWALFSDSHLPNEEKVGLRHTHTLVWLYLKEEFDAMTVPGAGAIQLLRYRQHNPAERNGYGY